MAKGRKGKSGRKSGSTSEEGRPSANPASPKKRKRSQDIVKEPKVSKDSHPGNKKQKKNKTPPSPPEEPEDVNPLEGMMVGNEMVLVDRKLAKVYSATIRSEMGGREQVGTVDDDGKVILFDKPLTDAAQPTVEEEFPFETDPDDHCESPLSAYKDMVPLLKACSGKDPSKLQIYDPYFCNGTVVRNLQELGFPNVYNVKEDCYQVWASKNHYPSHDILLTNPPYSGDHIEKLVDHITSKSFGDRPWMLLLPQWVHKKDYFLSKTKHIQPFYIVPHKRYVYVPPPSFREAKKSDVHKKSSPFVSMWFIWGGTPAQNAKWLTLAHRIPNCDVARSKSALRDLRRKKK